MSRSKLYLLVLMLPALVAAGAMSAEVFFQEAITDTATYRITIDISGGGSVLWQETIEGNPGFGVPTHEITYSHSVLDIYPPLLPDGSVRTARLKLYLRSYGHDDIELTVDTIDLESLVRRHFVIDPDGNDYLDVEESSMKDGTIDITLSNPEKEFILYRSVFDLQYHPGSSSDIDDGSSTVPESYELSANYPNPFNPTTEIEYTLGARTHVQVVVYDLLGRHVTTLVDEAQSAGDHATSWDGTDADGNPSPTGVYFYRIETKYFRTAKKMMLLK